VDTTLRRRSLISILQRGRVCPRCGMAEFCAWIATLLTWLCLLAGNALCTLALVRTYCDDEAMTPVLVCRMPALWVTIVIYLVAHAIVVGFAHGLRRANPILTLRHIVCEVQRRIKDMMFEERHVLTWREGCTMRSESIPVAEDA
jgi:hypothetical protein